LGKTVQNSRRYSGRKIQDGFKPSTKNRLDFIPDSFLPFMDDLKPSRNGDFFCSGLSLYIWKAQRSVHLVSHNIYEKYL
jgi:hypothetical protein